MNRLLGSAVLGILLGTMAGASSAEQPTVVTDGTVKLKHNDGVTVVVPTKIHPDAVDGGTLSPQAVAVGCFASNTTGGITGYISGFLGSYAPTGLTGGKAVNAIFDITCPGNVGNFTASGFASDPGASWLTSVTCNRITYLGSTATYNYSGGSAAWSWPTGFGFQLRVSSSCSINHS